MIGRIAAGVVEKLTDRTTISDTEKELYLYGFFIVIAQILYFVITIIMGVLMDIVLLSAVFYISFQFIRRYAGGIHASSELKCEIISITSIFICLLCVKSNVMFDIQIPTLILTVVASIVIFVLCPLDTPEKPLTEKELRYFRKISIIVLTIMLFIIIISIVVKLTIAYPICFSIILESVFLVAGKIKREHNNKNVE